MADSFSTSVTTGFGNRIINSIKGIVIGLILFISSFSLLYWNEGRVDLSNIAKTATEISSKTVSTDVSQNGKLISTSGSVNSEEIIGDDLFLKPDRFVAVNRKVEMYSWIEKSKSQKSTNVGGSETTNTTYTYSQGWEENPESSSSFSQQEGHINPPKSVVSNTKRASTAMVGVYTFDPQSATLPEFTNLGLSLQNVILNPETILANSNYLFIRKSVDGTIGTPQIGDFRVSYQILRPGFEGTIFGKLNGKKIDLYVDQKGNQLYRVFSGTRDQAISTLHTEHTILLWIFRLVGFLLMWIGLSTLFAPISVLLDILPIFGTISRSIIGTITFFVSLVLTIVTILVSMIIHNFVALIISIIVVVGVIIAAFIMFKNRKVQTITTASLPNQAFSSVNQPGNYEREMGADTLSRDEVAQVPMDFNQMNSVIQGSSKRKYTLIVIVIFVVVIIGIGVYFVYPNLVASNIKKPSSAVSEEQQGAIVVSKNSQEQTVTQDPIVLFSQEFKANNYLVKVTGTDQEYYFDHGTLVRAGKETQLPGKAYFIFKKGTVFDIFPSEKTFKTFASDSEQGKAIFDEAFYGILLNPLLEGTSKNSFEWQTVGQKSYTLKKNQNAENTTRSFPSYVQIMADNKGLISSINTSEDNSNWTSRMFTYEIIDDLSQRIIFPFDYTKTDSGNTQLMVPVVAPLTITAASLISSISPIQGSKDTTVTIFGTNLADVSNILFFTPTGPTAGSSQGSVVPLSVSSNSVTFKIAGSFGAEFFAPGSYNLKVVNPSGMSNAMLFTLVEP